MEAKHTPGPWLIRRQGMASPHYWHIESESGRYIANFHRLVEGEQDQQAADARLIAAAPELLEALQEAVALANRNARLRLDGTPERSPECQASYDMCVAAIAKATGV